MTRLAVVFLHFFTVTTCRDWTLSYVVASDENETSNPVCSLPPEVGNCRGAFSRYYFDQQEQECLLFSYGGCGGNGNNFENITDCEATCPPVPTCQQPVAVGPCDAAIPRLYYDATTGECLPFSYGGCGGNSNNFESFSECEATCPPLPTCQQPVVVGPCEAVIPRFYHDSTTEECLPFTYGGCGGNSNNFESLSECEATCSGRYASCEWVCDQHSVCTLFCEIYRFFRNLFGV